MSRDVFVQDLPPGITSIAEIPANFRPRSIGTRTRVIETIQRVAPKADFSDPSWGILAEPDTFHIEVSLGQNEELIGFAFHVSGGVEAEQLIAQILDALNLRALDPSSESGLFHIPIVYAP